MKPLISIIFLMGFLHMDALSQPENDDAIPVFNPSVSSIMLHPGQWEFNLFTSYLFHPDPKQYAMDFINASEGITVLPVTSNNTYRTGTFQTTVGVTGGLSVGFDVNFTKEYLEQRIDTTTYTYDNSIVRLGPRLRYSLYTAKKSNLVLQHYLQLPVQGQDSLSNIFGQLNFGNQMIWTLRLNHFIIMNQLDFLIYGKDDTDNSYPFVIPYTFYSSYLVSTETMIFGLFHYVADFGNVSYAANPDTYYNRASSLSVGLGLQQRIARNLSVNVYYNQTLSYKEYLGYNSVNLGFRYATR